MKAKYQEWNEGDRKLFKEWLVGHLSYGEVTVNFTKKDGEEREMRCTLNEELTPPYEKKTERKVNEEVCFVYDLDKDAWRSFRFDSVTQVRFSIGEA